MLCDIGELNWIFSDSKGTGTFLQKIVTMVARHMHAQVCSIYLFDSSTERLMLKATHGLNPAHIDKISLRIGEGLTGMALKELRPICETNSSIHPNYKFFEGSFEEHFESFLAVPILRGIEKIGVLVVQRKNNAPFTDTDIIAMRAVSNQLANIIENARALLSLNGRIGSKQDARKPKLDSFIKAKSASAGYALGNIVVEEKNKAFAYFKTRRFTTDYSLDDFEKAITYTTRQLESFQEHVEEQLSDVASLIFAAHLLLLQDEQFVGTIRRLIHEGNNPPEATMRVASRYIDLLSSNENPYFREKADDIKDLALRIIHNLTAAEKKEGNYTNRIVIARELLPSDILKISIEGALGVILVGGGVTSHLSILARSLHMPLIIADVAQLLDLPQSTLILMDGELGNIFINPDKNIITTFQEREKAREHSCSIRHKAKAQTYTRDNTRIHILSNINLLTDLQAAQQLGCEGIGLYRSEFPFIIRNNFPSEEEQYVVYRKLVKGMPGKPMTFRTLDIGGDKVLSYYDWFKEQNPFLGMRSIRFTLNKKDVFIQQLRAILRAGHDADLKIMFPMISSLDEMQAARALVNQCLEQLSREKVKYNKKPHIGMMVEIPSVIELIDEFAQLVDFFSIGTNDLIQYLLAVDRTNEKVSYLYLPHHPAVLRAMNRIVSAAHSNETPVSVCGDMAHDPHYIPFLLGIGVTSFSVDPVFIPAVQTSVQSTSLKEAQSVAGNLLRASEISVIENFLNI